MGGVGVTVFFPKDQASTVHGKQMKVNKCCSLDSLSTVVMKRHLRKGTACNCKEYTPRKTNK